MGLFSQESSYVGIDMGSTSIKIVELKRVGKKIALATYGFSENSDLPQQDWQKDIGSTAKVIRQICDESGIISRNSISALPTFSVFSSLINLSNIAKKDMAGAVHWEAKKVIPLPLEDMVLDWKIVESESKNKKSKKGINNVRVLLTGAPKTLVKKYVEIFKQAQINLLSLETETFSLIRSLLGNDKNTAMIVEFGASTTDVTIVDKGIPILSRSIDVGGIALTKTISKQLGIDYIRAEQFKYDLGISSFDSLNNSENKSKKDVSIPKIISESLSPIVNEIKYAINLFQNKYQKNTEKIILSGGSSLLSELVPYFSSLLDTKVIIGNPWSRVEYPKEIKPILQEIGPRMSVAIGLALREFE